MHSNNEMTFDAPNIILQSPRTQQTDRHKLHGLKPFPADLRKNFFE